MDDLRDHLEAAYGIGVGRIDGLDLDVYRVEPAAGPAWVARVFGPERRRADVEGDAALLARLAEAGFPAERCATETPVTSFDDCTVLVTGFVEGERPDGRGRTYAYLGALLGRLHAHSGDDLRPGGGWHRLTPQGDARAEIRAARALADGLSPKLRVAVETLDDCADLPHAFVHPDLVPVNAIDTGNTLTVIDWTGAGRGPRLWSLAPLLMAAGATSPKLVDVVASRYRRHVALTEPELDRLAGVLRARALLLDVWSVAAGRKSLRAALAAIDEDRELAGDIAGRARNALSGESD